VSVVDVVAITMSRRHATVEFPKSMLAARRRFLVDIIKAKDL
jgi:hypothetical protein